MISDIDADIQASLAVLLSSAKMALAMRLMSMAEKNLDRPDEAEQTLYEAMRLFKAAPVKTCLETLYSETDDALESGQRQLMLHVLTKHKEGHRSSTSAATAP